MPLQPRPTDARLTHLWTNGIRVREIADELGYTIEGLAHRAHQLGLAPRGAGGSGGALSDHKDELRALWCDRMWTDSAIAAHFSAKLGRTITRNAVIGQRHRMGLPQRAQAAKCDWPRQVVRRDPPAPALRPRRIPAPAPDAAPADAQHSAVNSSAGVPAGIDSGGEGSAAGLASTALPEFSCEGVAYLDSREIHCKALVAYAPGTHPSTWRVCGGRRVSEQHGYCATHAVAFSAGPAASSMRKWKHW